MRYYPDCTNGTVYWMEDDHARGANPFARECLLQIVTYLMTANHNNATCVGMFTIRRLSNIKENNLVQGLSSVLCNLQFLTVNIHQMVMAYL